jgi:hypothetical protein
MHHYAISIRESLDIDIQVALANEGFSILDLNSANTKDARKANCSTIGNELVKWLPKDIKIRISFNDVEYRTAQLLITLPAISQPFDVDLCLNHLAHYPFLYCDHSSFCERIHVYKLECTLIEKLCAIYARYDKVLKKKFDDWKQMDFKFVKHYYDAYIIIKSDRVADDQMDVWLAMKEAKLVEPNLSISHPCWNYSSWSDHVSDHMIRQFTSALSALPESPSLAECCDTILQFCSRFDFWKL